MLFMFQGKNISRLVFQENLNELYQRHVPSHNSSICEINSFIEFIEDI